MYLNQLSAICIRRPTKVSSIYKSKTDIYLKVTSTKGYIDQRSNNPNIISTNGPIDQGFH